MDADTIKDNMISFLGAFTLLLSLIFIHEIRKSKVYLTIVTVVIVALTWLGLDKIKREKRESTHQLRFC